MNRFLLVLLLGFVACAAVAAEPVVEDATAPACEKSEVERAPVRGAASTTPAKRPGATAPVRGNARTAAPRWNSLLPGMFR